MRTNTPTDRGEGGDFRWDWVTVLVASLVVALLLMLTFELWISH